MPIGSGASETKGNPMEEVPPQWALVSSGRTRLVHASSLVALGNGRLRAFWFAGSREGAGDVQIHSSLYDPDAGGWQPEQVAVDRNLLELGVYRYIKKLGNPVVFRAANGRLYLFVVSVSVGGWAGSALNVLLSDDNGASWHTPRRLVTSPFFNISTLVKTPPLRYANGDIGLPAYHEFLNKFSLWIRLSPEGKVRDITRLNHGRRSLQPMVFAKSPTHLLAVSRYAGGEPAWRAPLSLSEDGGRHWQVMNSTDLPNPNSALGGFRTDDAFWIVSNFAEDNRHELTLSRSRDGVHWEPLYHFADKRMDWTEWPNSAGFSEDLRSQLAEVKVSDLQSVNRIIDHAVANLCDQPWDICQYQFDYPYVIRDGERVHLVFTWNKSAIMHVTFSVSWLETLEKQENSS